MPLNKLRTICMSSPGATEGIKREDHIYFMVAGKMFCITYEQGGANVKVTPEQFDELTTVTFFLPVPYMAHNEWLYIERF